jgi:alkylation response protein AidB-like acyl-CoA dehydrogenase
MDHTVEMTAPEQARAIEIAREIAQEFDRVGAKHDRDNTFPYELAPIFRDSGLVALNVPKRFGGLGGDIWTTVRCVEELAKGDPACALGYNMHLGVIGFFRGMWSEEHQQRYFPGIARHGHIFDGVYSEIRAGVSGLADTFAVPVRGGYEITGRKAWGTLSLVADFHSVTATVADPDGTLPADLYVRAEREMMFVVPKDAPGLSIEKTWDTMGMRATGTETVVFEKVFVPDDDLVSRTFRSSIYQTVEWQTLTFAAVYLGLARKAYAETRLALIDKSTGPVVGPSTGPSVGPVSVRYRDLPYVQVGFGQMQVRIETMSAVLERACKELIAGIDTANDRFRRMVLVETPKVVATENAIQVVDMCMRVLGGGSYRRGHVIERLYRDARSGPFHPLRTDQLFDLLGKADLGVLGANSTSR